MMPLMSMVSTNSNIAQESGVRRQRNSKAMRLPCFTGVAIALLSASLMASATPVLKQITSGPAHHFYGYIGHAGNTPWNASGRYMILLSVPFSDRMPSAEDAADILLLDMVREYSAVKVDETRAWNPQQGTMLYWNPEEPDSQFFFNDRDPRTQRIFCVLYDVDEGRRVREYRFEDTPVGNSGVAQRGGFFLGLNYGRLDRLRKVTGYDNAYDWTEGECAPENDGVFKVNINSGEKTLLVSFAALAGALRETLPRMDDTALFINHTLWSRDDSYILFYVRGNWNLKGPRTNEFFTMRNDGSCLTRHEVFPGGHPEWAGENTVIGAIGGRQVIYNVDSKRIERELGDRRIFSNPEGDIALSPDAQWLVNGSSQRDENVYVIYNMTNGAYFTTPGLKCGIHLKGDVRIDPAPCWRRDNNAIAVPGLAEDGTRQVFIISW